MIAAHANVASNDSMLTIRVTSGGKIQAYVGSALKLLQENPVTQSVLLCAQGNAVAKAVTVAEITKRRLRGLHQNTQIGSVRTDESDGNDASAATRSEATISIILSLQQLDVMQPGYQPPLSGEELDAAWIFDDHGGSDSIQQESAKRHRTRSRSKRQRGTPDAAQRADVLHLEAEKGSVGESSLPMLIDQDPVMVE